MVSLKHKSILVSQTDIPVSNQDFWWRNMFTQHNFQEAHLDCDNYLCKCAHRIKFQTKELAELVKSYLIDVGKWKVAKKLKIVSECNLALSCEVYMLRFPQKHKNH